MSSRYRGSEDPRSPKKLREQRVIAAVQALEPQLAGCEFRLGVPGTEPDFVCRSPHHSEGIEIVEYFRPERIGSSSVVKQQFLADQVTRSATAMCKQLGLQRVLAHVEFTFKVEIRPPAVPYLAQAVIPLIRPVAEGLTSSITCRDRNILPTPIGEIWACRRDNVPQPFVGRQWGGAVPEADLTHLQELITQKESKLSIYRRNCSTVWLVILVDPHETASMGYVPPKFRINRSAFDRVLVLQGWSYTIGLWESAA